MTWVLWVVLALVTGWVGWELLHAPLVPPDHPDFEERPWWLVGEPEEPGGWTQGDVYQTLLDIDHVDEVGAR